MLFLFLRPVFKLTEMEKFNISLLYVEDEKILRNVYEKILRARIKTLYVAENGEEGLRLYERHKPDLVLTDIKMPIMNGLEMTKRIKRLERNARIIIMSAYGQTQYFMQAIENGVSSFLLKPVENKKLFEQISDLSSEVLLEKKVIDQEQKRRTAEEAVKRSEAILKAVSYASEQFLQFNYGKDSIAKVLERLGKATGVSRVYIFENQRDSKENLQCSQRYEWVDEYTEPQIDNPLLQNCDFAKEGFGRWMEILPEGKTIFGNLETFPKSEIKLLKAQDIKSIAVVPVFSDNHWWGFVGFDDCKMERTWNIAEIKALSAAADILGAAIHRLKVEEELRELNNELENRVEERTKDLLKEINERKTAEIMLRESEEKYRQIFENANDGILLTVNKQIMFINPKLYEMTGYLPKECIGYHFNNFVHPDYRKMVADFHTKRLNGEKVPERYDIKIMDKQGNTKWLEIKSTLIRWEEKPAILTFLTDITERKKTAEELETLNQHLEQRVKEELKKIEHQQQLLIQKSKLESLGELAAGIAHEINQPLGGIAMGMDNILVKINDETFPKKYLEEKFKHIFEDIERIKKIINHVRIFSKDQDIAEFEKIDVNVVVENACSMVNTQYKNHNVELVKNLQNKNYTLGNKYKLEQVILNLLSNAKYAVDDKESLLKNKAYSKKILIRSHTNNKHVFIEVEDNGTGIADDKQLNIFDPFFTTKKNEIGTGLGLSISYGIIKEMKGDISVRSKEGKYTKMKISLPVYESK